MKTFKMITPKSATKPDISKFADDLLGPDLSGANPVEDEDIRMIKSKRKLAPFKEPLSEPEAIEAEEENEEGELASELGQEEAPEELSNHEQALQHGFNPHAKQKAAKWERFKNVDIKSIPNIIKKGVDEREATEPNIVQVKDLPGDVKTPIRALGRTLFSKITDTPVEDIQVVAHIDGHGPNSLDEVEAVEWWVYHTGQQNHDQIAELEKKIGGIKLFHTEGISHLIIDNAAGKYVFSWPSVEDKISK